MDIKDVHSVINHYFSEILQLLVTYEVNLDQIAVKLGVLTTNLHIEIDKTNIIEILNNNDSNVLEYVLEKINEIKKERLNE